MTLAHQTHSPAGVADHRVQRPHIYVTLVSDDNQWTLTIADSFRALDCGFKAEHEVAKPLEIQKRKRLVSDFLSQLRSLCTRK